MMFFVRIVPMTIVMGTIFFLSSQSGDTIDLSLFPGEDKVAHLTAYGTLALTVVWGYGKQGLKKPGITVLVTVLLCALYGVSDEFHQSFVENRYVSGWDLFADTSGAFLVSMIWLKSPSLRSKLMKYQRMLAGKGAGEQVTSE